MAAVAVTKATTEKISKSPCHSCWGIFIAGALGMCAAAQNDPQRIAKLVQMFEGAADGALIGNLKVDLRQITVGDLSLPMTISDPPNGYLCSPTVAYIDYALEELRHFAKNPVLRGMLATLIRACRPLVRATGLDQQVQPNNWLFSTNPVPLIDASTAIALRDQLLQGYPDRAIVIRSLNTYADDDSMEALQKAGFRLLPARQVYLLDHRLKKPPSRDMKRDAKLLRKSAYKVVDGADFSAEDFTRAAVLYGMLYLDQYSTLNPHYPPAFLARARATGLLQIIGLRGPDGVIDGVLGLFRNGKTLTAPFLGYDTGKPRQTGLYRMLTALGTAEGAKGGLLQNRSAGAASFKRNRNAVPAIEYTAVYVDHLGWRARMATALLGLLLNRIGVPVMLRYAL